MYKESMEACQRSYDLGIQIGYQRRNKEMMAWVKKRRRTIRREDLISFLCGKNPPPRASRALVAASRPPPPEAGSSMESDLQPFREAIALHGTSQKPSQGVDVWMETWQNGSNSAVETKTATSGPACQRTRYLSKLSSSLPPPAPPPAFSSAQTTSLVSPQFYKPFQWDIDL
ncbi:HUWE1-associated protein modifying stress responses-like [Vanacampus margaritifer]